MTTTAAAPETTRPTTDSLLAGINLTHNEMPRLNALLAAKNYVDVVLDGIVLLESEILAPTDSAPVCLAVAKGYLELSLGCDPATHNQTKDEYKLEARKFLCHAIDASPESLSVVDDALHLARRLNDPKLVSEIEIQLRKVLAIEIEGGIDPSRSFQTANTAFSLGLYPEAAQLLSQLVEHDPKGSQLAIKGLQNMIASLTESRTIQPGWLEPRSAISLLAAGKNREALGELYKLIQADIDQNSPVKPFHVVLARIAAYRAGAELEYVDMFDPLIVDKKPFFADPATHPLGSSVEDLQKTLSTMARTDESGAARSRFHAFTRLHTATPINGTASTALKSR